MRDMNGRIFMDWDSDDFSMILKELEACASDRDRAISMPDPSVKSLWKLLSLPSLLFDGSEILLNVEHRKWLCSTLIEAIGICDESEMSTELLYSCSDATKDAAAFHASCDGKGATVVLIRSTNGYIFGGYNPVSWRSPAGGAVECDSPDRAFLYSITNPAGTEPTKCSMKRRQG